MVWCKDTWLGFSALLALFSAVSVLWDGGTRGLPFGLGCVDVAYGGGVFLFGAFGFFVDIGSLVSLNSPGERLQLRGTVCVCLTIRR